MNTTTICDWGGCREAATRLLTNYCDDATVAEARPVCSRHAYCRHPGTVKAIRSRRRLEVRGARNGTLAVGPVGSFAGSHMADCQPLFHIERRLTPMLRRAALAASLRCFEVAS